jgi:hypothetical protein
MGEVFMAIGTRINGKCKQNIADVLTTILVLFGLDLGELAFIYAIWHR